MSISSAVLSVAAAAFGAVVAVEASTGFGAASPAVVGVVGVVFTTGSASGFDPSLRAAGAGRTADTPSVVDEGVAD
jgi:hypothetical protein